MSVFDMIWTRTLRGHFSESDYGSYQTTKESQLRDLEKSGLPSDVLRVSPDFAPPTGYSGIALYGEGTREDGSQGPGIVDFKLYSNKWKRSELRFGRPRI